MGIWREIETQLKKKPTGGYVQYSLSVKHVAEPTIENQLQKEPLRYLKYATNETTKTPNGYLQYTLYRFFSFFIKQLP
jgi:hypothetical protein